MHGTAIVEDKQQSLFSFILVNDLGDTFTNYLYLQAQKEEKNVRFAPEPEMEEIEVATEVLFPYSSSLNIYLCEFFISRKNLTADKKNEITNFLRGQEILVTHFWQ